MPGSSDHGELAAIQAETLDRLSMLIQRLSWNERHIRGVLDKTHYSASVPAQA